MEQNLAYSIWENSPDSMVKRKQKKEKQFLGKQFFIEIFAVANKKKKNRIIIL